MNNILKKKFVFEISQNNKMEILVPEDVFFPTGTTKILFDSAKEYIKKPGKILDLGCGCGVLGLALNKIGLIKPPLYASDLSKSSIKFLIEHAKKEKIEVDARIGSIFEPWIDKKFDYIINDISGVSSEVAELSPWFNKVPCNSGIDGSKLVSSVLNQAPNYLNKNGLLFFPVISLSNVSKIIKIAKMNFKNVTKIKGNDWPLPESMYKNLKKLISLEKEGYIELKEKFGMKLFYTSAYVAFN